VYLVLRVLRSHHCASSSAGITRISLPSLLAWMRNFASTQESVHFTGGSRIPVDQ
jgi:hypothetical protein